MITTIKVSNICKLQDLTFSRIKNYMQLECMRVELAAPSLYGLTLITMHVRGCFLVHISMKATAKAAIFARPNSYSLPTVSNIKRTLAWIKILFRY